MQSELVAQHLIALTALRYRSYWHRLWIVPEVALARDVTLHCGQKRMPWSAIQPALDIIEEKRQCYLVEGPMPIMKSANPNSFDDLQRYRSDNRKFSGWSLHSLLDAFGQLQCSEIRDRVYALLGAKTSFRADRPSVVDYACDIEELFFDALLFCTPMSTCANSISFCSYLLSILELTPKRCLSWVAERRTDQVSYLEQHCLLSLDEFRQLGRLTYQSLATNPKYGDHNLTKLTIKHLHAEILTCSHAKTGDIIYELHQCGAGPIYRRTPAMKHASRVKNLLQMKQEYENSFVGIGVRHDLVQSDAARVVFDYFKDSARLARMCGFRDRQTLNCIGREDPCKVRLSGLALVILSMCLLPE